MTTRKLSIDIGKSGKKSINQYEIQSELGRFYPATLLVEVSMERSS